MLVDSVLRLHAMSHLPYNIENMNIGTDEENMHDYHQTFWGLILSVQSCEIVSMDSAWNHYIEGWMVTWSMISRDPKRHGHDVFLVMIMIIIIITIITARRT